MAKVTPEDDAKLQHLQALILKKIENPINDGNKKVLLFTAFADTANYLYNNLAVPFLLQKACTPAKSQARTHRNQRSRKATISNPADAFLTPIQGKGAGAAK